MLTFLVCITVFWASNNAAILPTKLPETEYIAEPPFRDGFKTPSNIGFNSATNTFTRVYNSRPDDIIPLANLAGYPQSGYALSSDVIPLAKIGTSQSSSSYSQSNDDFLVLPKLSGPSQTSKIQTAKFGSQISSSAGHYPDPSDIIPLTKLGPTQSSSFFQSSEDIYALPKQSTSFQSSGLKVSNSPKQYNGSPIPVLTSSSGVEGFNSFATKSGGDVQVVPDSETLIRLVEYKPLTIPVFYKVEYTGFANNGSLVKSGSSESAAGYLQYLLRNGLLAKLQGASSGYSGVDSYTASGIDNGNIDLDGSQIFDNGVARSGSGRSYSGQVSAQNSAINEANVTSNNSSVKSSTSSGVNGFYGINGFIRTVYYNQAGEVISEDEYLKSLDSSKLSSVVNSNLPIQSKIISKFTKTEASTVTPTSQVATTSTTTQLPTTSTTTTTTQLPTTSTTTTTTTTQLPTTSTTTEFPKTSTITTTTTTPLTSVLLRTSTATSSKESIEPITSPEQSGYVGTNGFTKTVYYNLAGEIVTEEESKRHSTTEKNDSESSSYKVPLLESVTAGTDRNQKSFNFKNTSSSEVSSGSLVTSENTSQTSSSKISHSGSKLSAIDTSQPISLKELAKVKQALAIGSLSSLSGNSKTTSTSYSNSQKKPINLLEPPNVYSGIYVDPNVKPPVLDYRSLHEPVILNDISKLYYGSLTSSSSASSESQTSTTSQSSKLNNDFKSGSFKSNTPSKLTSSSVGSNSSGTKSTVSATSTSGYSTSSGSGIKSSLGSSKVSTVASGSISGGSSGLSSSLKSLSGLKSPTTTGYATTNKGLTASSIASVPRYSSGLKSSSTTGGLSNKGSSGVSGSSSTNKFGSIASTSKESSSGLKSNVNNGSFSSVSVNSGANKGKLSSSGISSLSSSTSSSGLRSTAGSSLSTSSGSGSLTGSKIYGTVVGTKTLSTPTTSSFYSNGKISSTGNSGSSVSSTNPKILGTGFNQTGSYNSAHYNSKLSGSVGGAGLSKYSSTTSGVVGSSGQSKYTTGGFSKTNTTSLGGKLSSGLSSGIDSTGTNIGSYHYKSTSSGSPSVTVSGSSLSKESSSGPGFNSKGSSTASAISSPILLGSLNGKGNGEYNSYYSNSKTAIPSSIFDTSSGFFAKNNGNSGLSSSGVSSSNTGLDNSAFSKYYYSSKTSGTVPPVFLSSGNVFAKSSLGNGVSSSNSGSSEYSSYFYSSESSSTGTKPVITTKTLLV